MNSYKKSRSLSRIILLFSATTLLINTTCITQAAEAAKKSWIRRAFGTAKETFSERIVGTLKGLAGKAKNQIHSSVAATYEKVKGFDRTVIIDQLLKNITRLGTQIGGIKDCMLFGRDCSSAKRAAFYATAITVLALTAAVVGFTITVAATSKEPDQELEKAVNETSDEVKGWSAEAIFQRLNSKISSFKDNLLSMKQCLTKRQCTKTQKRTLYATAATMVALVTISIGIGIGSYIYAERKRRKDLDREKGIELPATGEEVSVLEDMQRQLEAAQAAQDTAEQQRIEKEIQEEQERLKKLLEMPEFSDTPAPPEEVKGFAARVRRFIKPVQGIPTALREAYAQVKKEIQEGVIKSRKKAGEVFAKITAKHDFREIIKNATTAHMQRALAALGNLKTHFSSFGGKLKNLWAGKMVVLTQGVVDLLDYGKNTMKKVEDAIEAYKGYSAELGQVVRGKIREARRQIEESDTEKEKTAAQRNLQEAQEEQRKLERQKLLPTQVAAAKVRKPGDFERAFQKVRTEIATLETNQREEALMLQNLEAQLSQQGQTRERMKAIAALREMHESYTRQLRVAYNKIELLQREQLFDAGTNLEFLRNIYPTLIQKMNRLELSPIGTVVKALFRAFGKSLKIVGQISRLPGLGRVISPEKIRAGLQDIIAGLDSFGTYSKQILDSQPLVPRENETLEGLTVSVVKAGISPAFLLKSIQNTVAMLRQNLPAIGMGVRQVGVEAGLGVMSTASVRAFKDFEQTYEEFQEKLGEFTFANIRNAFIAEIQKAPIKMIPRSPQILVDIIGSKIRPLRDAANKMITASSVHMKNAVETLPTMFKFFEDLNIFMRKVNGKPFINTGAMDAFKHILDDSVQKMYRGTMGLLEGLKLREGAAAA